MLNDLPVLNRASYNLSKFPTIGTKTSLRLILHIINMENDEVDDLVQSIKDLKEKIIFCSVCNSFTDNEEAVCNVCKSSDRDASVLCVVEQPMDVLVIEHANIFYGKYFVLKGIIDLLNGIGPEDIEINSLINYIKSNDNLKEVIIATSPTLKGENTANYIEEELKEYGIKISRIAYGMPVGASLDYADAVTLKKSFEGRTFKK